LDIFDMCKDLQKGLIQISLRFNNAEILHGFILNQAFSHLK